MPPEDESIRTDASTVHRSDAAVPSAPLSGSGVAGSGVADSGVADSGPGMPLSHSEAEQIAQAQTVIRGSSRVDRSSERAHPIDRTPAAVAGVLLGQRLNHFLLEELIGGGGMGAVFRAHDEHLDRTVAIKVIPFVGDDPDLQRRFRNEAQSAAKLDHPRIARVFDAGSHGEWHYIVFEYIEGTNIRDLVTRDGVMSIDDAVFYTSQLADALQHAADRGIVHRDIKPSNVLIGSEGKLKLVDMGLARSDNLDLSDDMTASGVTLGTFDYISPEQAKDPRDADLRSDIYSLGCTMYFMLTGQPPYPGGTMLQKLLSHGNAPPPDPRELRPEVSDNLVAVICKMLAKDPANRYQTATDLIADLREVAMRDGLIRSQALGPVTISQPNPLISWLETYAPWIVAASLLIASAGWMHLESAASRDLVQIPDSARTPVIGTVRLPVESAAGDLQLTPSAESSPDAAEPSGDPGAVGRDDAAPPEFGPPDEPPTLGNVRAPSEASESVSAAGPGAAPPMRDDPPFGIRQPFVDSDDDVSVEPLDRALPGVAPTVVRLIDPDRIADVDPSDKEVAIATSLPRALELAAQYRAPRIEIAVPVVRSNPVRVNVDDLLITSTVGGSMIVFEPTDSVAMERSKMFSIGSHSIEFDDIHFSWTVPSGDIDGGTLFEVNDNQLVRFTDCSITVRNPTLRDEVYAFDVITDPDKLPGRRGDDDQLPLVWLELYNVVVRGQMTMLHMDYAAKLLLSWDNGLLAVSERMIDTAGARREPPATESISLSFSRVTVHAPMGIVRMRAGVSGAYPVPVVRRASKSLFLVDPSTPQFDFSGIPETSGISEAPPLLRLSGASNAYAADAALSDPILRLAPTSGTTEIVRMSDLRQSPPAWASETKPRWTINWEMGSLGPEIAASRRTPGDYRQTDASPPGCDEKSLPGILEPPEGGNDLSNRLLDRRNGGNFDEL